MAGEDLSFPVCGNNGDDCYFSQTCRKLANMAGALRVMMLSEGNKHKEVRFIKSRVWSCSGFTGHRGAGPAFDQLHLKSGLGCSLFTPRVVETWLSDQTCAIYTTTNELRISSYWSFPSKSNNKVLTYSLYNFFFHWYIYICHVDALNHNLIKFLVWIAHIWWN